LLHQSSPFILREKSNFNKYRLKIHGRLAGKTHNKALLPLYLLN
jgi:hypothetical protein